MSRHQEGPRDALRDHRCMERQLIASAVLLFLIAGGVLVGVIYGWKAVATALLCLLPGLLALIALWLLLRFLERLTDRWH